MGIQINGQTDTITAIDGALTVSGAELPTVTNLNASGIVTATGFVGNITGNVNATGVSTIATLNVTQSNPTNLNVSGVATVSAGSVSAPSITPTGDSNTGIFFPSADTICIGEGGNEVVRIHNLGRVLVGTANTDIAGAPSNKGAKQFIYTADGNGEWALQARNDSPTGNGFFLRAGNSSTTYTARFTGYDENNVHLNVDGLGRVTTPKQPSFSVRRNNNQTISHNTTTKVQWNTEVFDVGSNFDSSTNYRFTAPVAGKYLFMGHLYIYSTYQVEVYVYKNGSSYKRFAGPIGSGGNDNPNGIDFMDIVDLAINDYVEIYAYHARTGDTANADIYGGDIKETSFVGYLIG
jgi:hypothetical protein